MAINDLYQATFYQHQLGSSEPLLMNLWFNGVDIGANAGNLGDALLEADGLGDLINALQTAKMVNDRLVVVNLFSFTDFAELDWVGTGAYTVSQTLPVFNAVKFTKKTDNRAINNGTFAVSGIPEEAQVDGLITEAGYIGLTNDLASALVEDVVGDVALSYDPVVVKRIQYDVPDSDPVTQAYRLPANLAKRISHIYRLFW